MAVLVPDLIYHDDAFQSGLALELDESTGRITRIARASDFESRSVAQLRGRALMPGFVNAHSHAFQRLIRGRTQWRPADDTVANFWSWREAMYIAAHQLSPRDVYEVSRYCFIEMLRAGITTVGEFHYLHNAQDGQPYADRAELARRVIAAARDAGIRISLLNSCYAAGGIGEALGERQRRFDTGTLDTFLATTERLATDVAGDAGVSVGIAPHSIRAVPRDWLGPLHSWATERDVPFHMHVSEQPAEVDACVRAFGLRPVEMLDEVGVLDERFTGVHATHISDREVLMLASSGGTVCACPATERDLGDGFLRGGDLLRAGTAIALGTDSQTMLDMFEEARLVEYNERLRRLERVLLTRPASDVLETAPVLIRMATAAGARSLRVPAGVLAEGTLADFIGIDLEHIALAGWTAQTLPAMLTFSAAPDAVSDVWVGGKHVVANRLHPMQEAAMREFNGVARRSFT